MAQTQMREEETHPWRWFGPDDSRTLIVGTFPTTKRRWSYDFFYPNTANFFWRVLARASDSELEYFSGIEAVSERKNILRKLKATVTDMGEKILRNDNSALDEKLMPLAYMDIFKILEEKPLIQKIIFTSSSGKVSATKWFNNFLLQRGILHRFSQGKKPIKSVLQHQNKEIELVVLYSTSPRAANRISFDELVRMYKAEIIG